MSGKDIALIITGEKIEIDKSLVDTLEAPIVHMTRNAADHGIELPADRIKKGKNPQGCIEVKVVETDDEISLSISDDGAGLRLDAIRDKAKAMGLIATDRSSMSEKEIIEFLFMSGVSTAEKVTEVSGRGVGMDVVKRNIESAGGSIKVKTERDRGTSFTMVLPKSVTTQIIDGFVIACQGILCVIPVKSVIETFEFKSEYCHSRRSGHQSIQHGHTIYPLIFLAELFSDRLGASSAELRHHVVIVAEKEQKLALVVEQLVGLQQVVMKDLSGLSFNAELFSGAAIMGDGNIALVLDPSRVRSHVVAPKPISTIIPARYQLA